MDRALSQHDDTPDRKRHGAQRVQFPSTEGMASMVAMGKPFFRSVGRSVRRWVRPEREYAGRGHQRAHYRNHA